MLLDDDVIAQHFDALLCAAEALKQATIAPQRPPLPTPSYAYLDERSTNGSPNSSLPRAANDPAGHSAAVTPTNGSSSCGKSDRERRHGLPLADLDLTCIHHPVQLSRMVGNSDLDTLRHIGSVLEAIATQLQESVDAKLVDFYTHLAKKANTGVAGGACATALVTASSTTRALRKAAEAESGSSPLTETDRIGPASILPDGAPASHAPAATATQLLPSVKAVVSSSSSSHAKSSCEAAATAMAPVEAAPSPSRLRAGFILDPQDALPSPIASATFSNLGENESSRLLGHNRQDDASNTAANSRRSSLHQTKQLGSRSTSSYTLLHNAPMARRIEEEHAAAAELQSFFCLLLEAAIHLTDATAAAIYLDDASLHTASGNDQTFLRTTSFVGGTRSVLRSTSAAGGGGGGGGSAAGRAQFLHCVAHVRGHFPQTISYALTNVLTTVAQTGIAVNLNYSDSSAVLRPGGLGGPSSQQTNSKTDAAAAPTDPSMYLNMYNGVVVPIKGVGCLVLANKAKRASSVKNAVPPRFSVLDEHVAWSSALISEAVFQQYDRELLLRVTSWAPPCAVALRPFLQVKDTSTSAITTAAGEGGSSRLRNNHSSRTLVERRHPDSKFGSRRRLPVSKTVKILPDPGSLLDDLQRDEAASLVFNAHNDMLSKRLTIVRTEDRQVSKALPPELRAASPKSTLPPTTQKVIAAVARSSGGGGGGARTFTGSSGELNDEDLFLSAAHYITNLESLWRKTIADSNTMHTMVDNYNKEIQQRGEKITHLESHIRELNAHVAQLERRNNPVRF
ncbi:hypothetical protein N2W54_005866 [Lotmaria passim]